MKRLLILSLTIIGFVACASIPRTTPLLEQTRVDYRLAQNNPQVARFAPLELQQAQVAMDKTEKAVAEQESLNNIDGLAYLTKQKVAIAQEVSKQKGAEAMVKTTEQQRDQLRLDQRTKEVNQANAVASQAQRDTNIAQSETLAAKQLTQDAEAKAAKLEAQLNALAAKKTERGIVITFSDVLFAVDQSRLTSDGISNVQRLTEVLQQNPQRTVLIEGFTDSTGSHIYNQDLSERRSAAVRTVLVSQGIDGRRISVRGYGEQFPVAGNASAEDRRLNRRVEIILSDASGIINARKMSTTD